MITVQVHGDNVDPEAIAERIEHVLGDELELRFDSDLEVTIEEAE